MNCILSKSRCYLIVIVFLIISNIFSIFWFIDAKNDLEINEYKYIDIARNFIDQEDFIVNLQPIRDKVNQMSKDFGEDKVSIYLEFLNTGANISVNKENYIWPASLTKLPVAMATMKKVEDGEWQLNNELVLMSGDANIDSGNIDSMLAKNPVGTRFTIEHLLKELLTNSDNTAYNILMRNLSADELNQVKNELGIEVLFDESGRMSAKEYSRIFRALYTSSFLKRVNSEMIMSWLDESQFNDFLAKNIDPSIPFPHKYGENLLLNVYADSGIVYLEDRPYMITVMVQGASEQPVAEAKNQATSFMQDISQEVYTYFQSVE
ncbi:MAG: beta-lactamase class [Patescibacteria group bacterium]|nr:beta-lactamase class [Patescibacteria group bacterium]